MDEKTEIINSELSKDILKIYEPYFLMFPEYYRVFLDFINNIIYKDNNNSFSLQNKLFYGFMASSTIGCEYLLLDFEKIFLVLGGEKSWIEEGIKCKGIPDSIRGMANINNILAHKPWILDYRNFLTFSNCLNDFLFQSAIILTSIQRFASILCSLNFITQKDIGDEKKGKNNEEKIPDYKNISKTNENQKANKDYIYIDLSKKKRKIKDEDIEDEIQKVIISVKKSYQEKKEKEKRKENEESNENKEEEKKEEERKDINYKKDVFKKYISEFIISYNNFNPHIEKYLLAEDFNWNDNAKYFYFDYAGKEMEYLDKDLKALQNLSFENNNKDIKINIFELGNTIEKYLNLIFGIHDEDYNYHLTNESLPVVLKRIIKKVACFPDQILEQELESCLEVLSKKQLVYLIFMVASIKQKISLTYFANAFCDFNNKALKKNDIDN